LLVQREKCIERYRDKKTIVGVYTAFHRRSRQFLARPLRRFLIERQPSLELTMKRNLIATLLIAASATLAAPAFASGYGPAPFYRPAVGAPSSQQGPSAQTIAAEEAAHGDNRAFGGSRDSLAQSGNRAQANGDNNANSVFFGH
jgi:hypothetical protein